MRKKIETINSFIDKSIGSWKSIRSTHSLAFQEFENTNSNIIISKINIDSSEVNEILKDFNFELKSPFAIKISWKAKSDWVEEPIVKVDQATLIFSKNDSSKGLILKEKGYAELVPSFSNYYLDYEGGLNITTEYNSTISFERINFLSENVRFRYSIIKNKSTHSIIQTSHSSEIRELSI